MGTRTNVYRVLTNILTTGHQGFGKYWLGSNTWADYYVYQYIQLIRNDLVTGGLRCLVPQPVTPWCRAGKSPGFWFNQRSEVLSMWTGSLPHRTPACDDETMAISKLIDREGKGAPPLFIRVCVAETWRASWNESVFLWVCTVPGEGRVDQGTVPLHSNEVWCCCPREVAIRA